MRGRGLGQDCRWDRQQVVCVPECHPSMVAGLERQPARDHGEMASEHADDQLTVPAAEGGPDQNRDRAPPENARMWPQGRGGAWGCLHLGEIEAKKLIST